MSGSYLFPKLSRERARDRLHELRLLQDEGGAKHPELDGQVELLLDGYTFESIGGQEVTARQLEDLREKALQIAHSCGFPGDRTVKARNMFDRQIGKLLHEEMQITPHQAADEDIWSHLTLGPLVDLASWRFPGLSEDRMLGNSPKSTLRRTWWRVEVLGPQGWNEENPLHEDETVQLMERTELSGAPVLARSIAAVFLQTVNANPNVKRMDLMRDALKRTYRLTPFVRLEVLPETERERQLREVFVDSARELLDGEDVIEPSTGGSGPNPDSSPYAFGISDEVSGQVQQSEDSDVDPSDSDAEIEPPGKLDEAVGHEPSPKAQRAPSHSSDSRSETVEMVSLDLVYRRIVDVVTSEAPVEGKSLPAVFEAASGLKVTKRGKRMMNKLAWSAKGRRFLTLDEETGAWLPGEKAVDDTRLFGDLSFAELVDLARRKKSEGEDPFESMLVEVHGDGRAPRVVASIVGMAIKASDG